MSKCIALYKGETEGAFVHPNCNKINPEDYTCTSTCGCEVMHITNHCCRARTVHASIYSPLCSAVKVINGTCYCSASAPCKDKGY